MGESISSYLTRLSQEKAEKQKRSRGKEKRITIILSEFDSRRLKYISNQFSSQPSVFARELIIQALKDSEDFLGIKEEDEDLGHYIDDDYIIPFTEYGAYINSTGPDDLEDEEISDEDKAAIRNRNLNAHGRA